MKNCLIVKGGDDLITDTIKGLLPSNTNKIYMFSDDTQSQWSPELREKYQQYVDTVSRNESQYAKALELKYDIFDLILYLQNSRMPTVQTDKRDLRDEVDHIMLKFQHNFPMGIGIEESIESVSSKNSVVLKTLSVFVDEGYSLKIENGKCQDGKWIGQLKVYETHNSDVNAILDVGNDMTKITYSPTGEELMTVFSISFTNDCESYIKRMIALITESYEYIENEEYNNPKEWQKYSLNRLYSYYCGYDTCIQELNELKNSSSLNRNEINSKVKEFINRYQAQKDSISDYMKKLENFIYYLYSYSGSFSSVTTNTPSAQDIDYGNYAKNPDNLTYKNAQEAFENMIEYIKYGTFVGDSESDRQTTDTALYCTNCKSTNVTLKGCPQCKHTDTIVTYGTLATEVLNSYNNNPVDLETQREKIRKSCDLKATLGDTLYKEFFSFVREDTYENTNFVSDGLSNVDLMNSTKELVQKAKQELAKVCISQHTLSGNVHSFVAYSELNKSDFPISNIYEKFALGNYMQYFSDGKRYKLRLTSEQFSWDDDGCKLDVEFSDVIRYLGGGISDLSSLIDKMSSIATTANTAKTQSDKGVKISKDFQKIKDEGLQSAFSNVLSARNIDTQIDERGILLRKFDYDLNDWSDYQMKLINRNIVMTTDKWKSAELAIGYGLYNGERHYGIWTPLLVGDILCGNKLKIYGGGDGSSENATVTIDGNGITLDGGAIKWTNKLSIESVDGLDGIIGNLQSQIDGEITSWFENYEPTTTNEPASTWTTDADKIKHEGDLFYNTATGAAYRYIYNSSTKQHEWNIITDTAITEALAKASKAQDTADGKRTTFYSSTLPSKYSQGDIWVLSGEVTISNIKYSPNTVLYAKTNTTESHGATLTDWNPATTKSAEEANENLDLFKTDVSKALGLGTTIITKDSVISPKIGGGYMYIKDNRTTDNTGISVEINPCGTTFTGHNSDYVFSVQKSNDVIMGINNQGDGYYSGEIQCGSGEIGGWEIDKYSIHKTIRSSDEKNSTRIIISSKGEISSTKYEKGGEHVDHGQVIPYTYINYVSISNGSFKSEFRERNDNNNAILDKYGVTINDGGTMKFYHGDDIKYEISPDGIKENGKNINEIYCVAKTGTDIVTNPGGWVDFTVSFGVTYKNQPFVNVMPTTTVVYENIRFIEYIGNSYDGYTGFKYSIYAQDSAGDYQTRWFAVGNVKV